MICEQLHFCEVCEEERKIKRHCPDRVLRVWRVQRDEFVERSWKGPLTFQCSRGVHNSALLNQSALFSRNPKVVASTSFKKVVIHIL